MKIHPGWLGLVLLTGIFMVGTPAHAYYTTKQSARTFNATTSLFAITYTFGSPDRDMYLPILALRDPSATSGNATLGYTLRDGRDGRDGLDAKNVSIVSGELHGIVLSKATIKDGRYFIPAGTAQTFTLVTLLTNPKATTTITNKLQVTSLPFTFVKAGISYENHLNPTELQYYTTPANPLKPGVVVNAVEKKGVSATYTLKLK